MQSRRMSGSTSSQSSAEKGRQLKSDKGRDQTRDPPTSRCQGCNRDNHQREDCRYRNHPDFNARGQWEGCIADRALRRWLKDEKDIKLNWGKRADGTPFPRFPMQLFPLLQLAKSPRTIEIIDDDVTMTVGIEMVSEETKEVVVVVVVVDKSTSLETQVRLVSLVV